MDVGKADHFRLSLSLKLIAGKTISVPSLLLSSVQMARVDGVRRLRTLALSGDTGQLLPSTRFSRAVSLLLLRSDNHSSIQIRLFLRRFREEIASRNSSPAPITCSIAANSLLCKKNGGTML